MTGRRVEFFRDELGAPDGRPSSESYASIASLLVSDVGNSTRWCLDLLSMLEDVRTGTSDEDEWLGNSCAGVITKNGFELTDLYDDEWTFRYGLDDAHDVTVDYLDFLARDTVRSEVDQWEATKGRRHPCRGHL
ncbi:hypothetical protein [Actinomadura opuntiae]|uniref:hypothetical protein n=1 Tax=Actinomadura sp. OS1-43 TaxID=604315 RepID=UPI00255A862F|nr:hypothetical protein [Actinomadura sp. OS1-43]MDL4816855.1 hypothetical protein [Actinomadura sp. OS1-43]